MGTQDWLTPAVENWPITLGLALVFLALFLWMCTPFAIFGVKRRLDRMTALLEEISAALKDGGGEREEEAKPPPEKPKT